MNHQQQSLYHALSYSRAFAKSRANGEDFSAIAQNLQDSIPYKLDIEKDAVKHRNAAEVSAQEKLTNESRSFHKLLSLEVEKELQHPEVLLKGIGNVDPAIGECIELLAKPSCSFSRLETAVAEFPWLQDTLMKLVNGEQFRRTDSYGKTIIVDNLRTAISFIGISNLQVLIPAIVFKRTIPQITDPYPEIKKRIWEHAISSANTAIFLSRVRERNKPLLYTSALFLNVGKNILIRIFFKAFDHLHQEQLLSAERARMQEKHDLVSKVTPDLDILQSLVEKHAMRLTVKFFQQMHLSYLPIAALYEGIQEADHTFIDSVLVAKAKEYAELRSLIQQKLIPASEILQWNKTLHLSVEEFTEINQMNITKLHFAKTE